MKFEVDLNVPWFLSGPLEITAADLSHSGRYTCVAKNAAGTAHRHVQLTVHGMRYAETLKPNMLLNMPLFNFCLIRSYITNAHVRLHINLDISVMNNCVHLHLIEPPVIQSHPSTLDVILNNHVTLPCRATGSPRPTITWQKEGINIFTTGESKIFIYSVPFNSLLNYFN